MVRPCETVADAEANCCAEDGLLIKVEGTSREL
jgi:hypothetical protein